jgi:hypothetical protein
MLHVGLFSTVINYDRKILATDVDWPEKLCQRLTEAHESGQRLHIIIVSEGAIDKSGKTITCEEIRQVAKIKIWNESIPNSVSGQNSECENPEFKHLRNNPEFRKEKERKKDRERKRKNEG